MANIQLWVQALIAYFLAPEIKMFDFIKKISFKKNTSPKGSSKTEEISKEFLQQIKSIQVKTNYLVNDIMAGEYETAFKGRGMEFNEVREYVPGDDIRAIDWNVTARTGHPFIKEFKEERELTVMLMVDVSSSNRFGSSKKLKSEITAEVAATLAFMAIKNNDKVGLILFSDKIEEYIPPKKGKGHIWLVIKSILSFESQKIKSEDEWLRKTDISKGLSFLRRVQKRKSVAFLISDFIDDNFIKDLKIAKQKHDIIAVKILDPRELSIPYSGIVELVDSETNEIIVINTKSSTFRDDFFKLADQDKQSLKNTLRRAGVDIIVVNTEKSYVDPILKFFKMREKRMI